VAELCLDGRLPAGARIDQLRGVVHLRYHPAERGQQTSRRQQLLHELALAVGAMSQELCSVNI
jgi:hypothetical protein